jgi:inosine-uridine nucleoside N-ribohydrolase
MPAAALSRRTLLSLIPPALASAQEERIPLPSGRVSIVLDTDTFNEIDDQFAVAYALLAPEAIQLDALYAAPFLNTRSTSAGDGMQRSFEEILRVLDRLGKSGAAPVLRGSNRFIREGGKPVDSPAAQDLIARAKAAASMLYVVAVGAPTNVSSALLLDPSIKDKITVVWLGGRPHDFPTAHEFNLQQDPPASQVLYESGVRLMVVPTTNVSEMLRTTQPELDFWLKGKSRIADYLHHIVIEHARERKVDFSKPWSKVIWDISCIAWLINPKWIPSKVVSAPVLTATLHWGATAGRHPVRVATHVDRDAVFHDLFSRLIKA